MGETQSGLESLSGVLRQMVSGRLGVATLFFAEGSIVLLTMNLGTVCSGRMDFLQGHNVQLPAFLTSDITPLSKRAKFPVTPSGLCSSSTNDVDDLTEDARHHQQQQPEDDFTPSPTVDSILDGQDSECSVIFDNFDDNRESENGRLRFLESDSERIDVDDDAISMTINENGSPISCENFASRKNRPSSYKAYHRQIEKRRRNKISTLISEIGNLVPMCVNASHRLDKLSMLELAVQQVRLLRRGNSDTEETSYRPSFLSEGEMKFLVEQNGFLLVLSCNQAHILYVSDSISNSTYHSPSDLVGRSLLDIIHPNDVDTVTSMLMPYPNLPSVGSISMYTGAGITGAKRSFYFRLKTSKQPIFDPAESSGSNRYSHKISGTSTIPVKATGFLKTWQTVPSTSESSPSESAANNVDPAKLVPFTCFIGVVTPLKKANSSNKEEDVTNESCQQYSSKHTADAVYLSVDQRVFPMSGYLPQDLIGNSEYSFVHKDDVKSLSDTYRQVLANNNHEQVVSDIYRFKMKHGGMLPMRTVASSLFNPFTHELEFITHQNYIIGGRGEGMRSDNEISSNEALTDKEKIICPVSPRYELPVVTPQTLNLLRDVGLKPELLSSLANFQRVSSCVTPHSAIRHNFSPFPVPSPRSFTDYTSDTNSSSSSAVARAEKQSSASSGYASGMDGLEGEG